jgi:hypothetical protein
MERLDWLVFSLTLMTRHYALEDGRDERYGLSDLAW